MGSKASLGGLIKLQSFTGELSVFRGSLEGSKASEIHWRVIRFQRFTGGLISLQRFTGGLIKLQSFTGGLSGFRDSLEGCQASEVHWRVIKL